MNWWSTIGNLISGAVGGLGAGGALSLYMRDRWLEKLKARYGKELEEFKDKLQTDQKQIQAQIDRSLFVTRAHFETEYLAMKEVSQSLAAIKIVYLRLNPLEADREITNTERSQLISQLRIANEEYLKKLSEWGVFIEPELYEQFDHCYIGADVELKRLSANSQFDRERVQSADYFWRSYRQACQLVRNRIQSLAVMPGA